MSATSSPRRSVEPPPPRSTLLRRAWVRFALKLALLELDQQERCFQTYPQETERVLQDTTQTRAEPRCSNVCSNVPDEGEGGEAELQYHTETRQRSRSPRRTTTEEWYNTDSDYDETIENAQRR